MTAPLLLAHLLVLLLLPGVLLGVINRTRAWWAGRRGASVFQPWFDLARLMRKQPVTSEVTTWVFTAGPLVVLATTLVSGLMVPLVAGTAPMVFPLDFVTVAYLWGLGRVAIMLAALDTGSSFEGMGASREALFGAAMEPALFAVLGVLAATTSAPSASTLLQLQAHDTRSLLMLASAIVAMVVVLQVEGGRVPVDDPATHLELTMVHEVMVLDHAGPELAALQYASAVKLTLCAAIVTALLWPVRASLHPALAVMGRVGVMLGVGVLVGSIESVTARVRVAAVPRYALVGLGAAGVMMLAALAGGGR